LKRVGDEFKSVKDEPFDSALLNNILKVLPSVRESSKTFLDAIHTKAAQENDESGLWTDPDKYPAVQDAKDVSPSYDDRADASASAYARVSWINI